MDITDIFHKRDSNNKGQNYSAEKEYRFAMVMSVERFFGTDTNIALSAKDSVLRDYPLILSDGIHYLEEVYLRTEHPMIEATCHIANIRLVKNEIKIAG